MARDTYKYLGMYNDNGDAQIKLFFFNWYFI